MTAARSELGSDRQVALLRAELAGRDEIIVVLQHAIRELHHELENLRVAHSYAGFAGAVPRLNGAEGCTLPDVLEFTGFEPDAAAVS